VSGIVAKLGEGAVDAGFVYASDVSSAGGRLRALALPAGLAPPIEYGAAVVAGAGHVAQARAFVSGLVHGAGQVALARSGFLPVRAR
jgi:molybdate transport system substrate-binding protein